MQSASSEAPQTATSVEQTSSPQISLQHGLSIPDNQTSDSLSRVETVRESGHYFNDTDIASVTSDDVHRGRSSDIGRLSSSDGSSKESSPGSRIDEYEKAHARPKRPADGMIFQIVPTDKDKKSRVSIHDFPNEVLTHILSHLPPDTLSLTSLISRRFHKLVTTPPAWRIAFARYFPGETALETIPSNSQFGNPEDEKSQKRAFTRLSALVTWRSEYILRTRLLRSLGRGRPALQGLSRSGGSRHSGGTAGAAVVTYGSGLLYPVSHIHAVFGVGLNKRQPFIMHGAVEQGAVSTSDPTSAKIGNWGLGDFEAFKHFADQFVGEVEYGLGPGDVVGMPNVMDISQPFGRVYGEACPGGRLFFTAANEQRGRFLPISSSPQHKLGIPNVTMIGCAICSVWIAKSDAVLKATNGLCGFLAGFSNGVLSAYALGINAGYDKRYEKGEPTAKWVLCPGVPIVGICIDERISSRRIASGRVWAAIINALGEVFYLTDIPVRPDFKGKMTSEDVDRLAWQTGRSVEWTLVESTRRAAKPDPYSTAAVDGSYSPRTSSDAQGLSEEQIVAETKEIEKFIVYKPKYLRSICDGWDMRRKIIVDFAGDDHHGAGEGIFVVSPGMDDGKPASIRRYTRCKTKVAVDFSLDTWPAIQPPAQRPSLFGSTPKANDSTFSSPSIYSIPRSRNSSQGDISDTKYKFDWHLSNLSFGELRGIRVSATATDDSDFAVLAAFEDPVLGMSGDSNTSSPLLSPLGRMPTSTSTEVPGHRARLLAIGTTSGCVLLWNMRASLSPAPDVVNTISPARIIYTKSPQISSLALTALYVVHGGNDGLVQAWDPLASTEEPIRTLNSRFSDRARRRIAQAEASVQGVGNNYYAAGAIVLDHDPTSLRGIVSLGTHLRYWSYSSTAADAYKGTKRSQLRRRSERGSNAGNAEQKVSATGRGLLKDYIASEKWELEREKLARRKEDERMSGRFGTDLLGAEASEAEILAYATMLSEEAYTSDEKRRATSRENSSVASPIPSRARDQQRQSVDAFDTDMEEAIRLSLLDSEQASSPPSTNELDIPIRYAKSSKHGTPNKNAKAGSSRSPAVTTPEDDLEFAIQLSLAEERSRLEDNDLFPSLGQSSASGVEDSRTKTSKKGKGKAKHG